jgi:hypothetical protein
MASQEKARFLGVMLSAASAAASLSLVEPASAVEYGLGT